MAAKKSQEMDSSIEIHASEEGLQVPSLKHRDDGSSKKLDLTKRADSATSLAPGQWRQTLPTGLPGPVTRRKPCHLAFLWWEDPGPTAAQCLPRPRDLNTIDHAVVIGTDEVTGQRDVTTHQGPVIRLDAGVGSGPGPRLRQEGRAPEPDTLTRQMLQGQAMLRGRQWRSSLLVLPLVISVITRGRRGIIGPCQVRSLGRPTCPDVRSSCSRSFHRHLWGEPSQWSRRLPDQQGWTSRQVWRARQTWQLWPTQQVWQAWWTKQRYGTSKVTSQQGITTRQQLTSPRVWTTRQVLPTRHRNRTWRVSTQHSHRNLQWTTQHIHRIQQWTT